MSPQQKEVLEFFLNQETLPSLLTLKYYKYHLLDDAKARLGAVADIRATFTDFQKYFYQEKVA